MFAGVRVFVLVVAVGVGIWAPASADVAADRIEKARAGTLTPTFQDDLPGMQRYDLVPGDGTGRPVELRGSAGSGSSAGSAGSQVDPRLRNRPTREGARRVDTREYEARERARDEAGPMGGVMTMFMWGLLAIGLLLVVFWFVAEIVKSDADVAVPAASGDAAAIQAQTAAIIDRPLGDADDLAARGEFVEAIHTLLLRTLQELAKSAMVRVERSHTSREILARVSLAPEAHEALSVLITYVELTHFGDEPAGASDYARCREQFTRFATAFRAGLAVQASPQRLGVAS